ncbi:hypothetical protein EDC04DRAFT_2615022 [Pisolithus marmoratus]|nr:hypothetical protein EDC04DRAFT_2615022 [Pisolithus marmoratus]
MSSEKQAMELNSEAVYDFATDYDSVGGVDETEGELVPGIEGEDENFNVVELEILACQRREWTQARKKEKSMLSLGKYAESSGNWRSMMTCGQSYGRKSGSHPLKQITAWLKKPLQTWKPWVTLWSGYKYSVQAVICKLYHDQILQKHACIKQEDGTQAHTQWIDLYQRALTAFMQDDLTEEQLWAAQHIVDKWNGAKGPTPEESRNAVRYGPMYLHNFAKEMWRYCGMRIISMTGWKDETGVVQACCDIGGGHTFNDIHTLNGPWREYLGRTFEDADVQEEDEQARIQNPRTKKSDPVESITNEEGMACRRPSASVPFKKFDGEVIPLVNGGNKKKQSQPATPYSSESIAEEGRTKSKVSHSKDATHNCRNTFVGKSQRLPPSDDERDDVDGTGKEEGSTDTISHKKFSHVKGGLERQVSCSKEGIQMHGKTTIPAKCQRYLPSNDDRVMASRSNKVGFRDAVSCKKVSHSKASTHAYIKPTTAGKQMRYLTTDDENEGTAIPTTNANANDLSDMELPMLSKPSTSQKSVVQKQSNYFKFLDYVAVTNLGWQGSSSQKNCRMHLNMQMTMALKAFHSSLREELCQAYPDNAKGLLH